MISEVCRAAARYERTLSVLPSHFWLDGIDRIRGSDFVIEPQTCPLLALECSLARVLRVDSRNSGQRRKTLPAGLHEGRKIGV